MRLAAIACVWVGVLLVLAGCQSSRLPNDPKELPEVLEPAAQPASPGFTARLKGIGGSSAVGTVRAVQRGDVLVIQLDMTNTPPGAYTWALHENGNCTSTNGFSAGAPWVPGGVRKQAVDMLPEFLVTADQSVAVTARIRDQRRDDIASFDGRSVLIYQGGSIKPIQPGVPNNAIACGVFEPARPIF